VAHWIVAETEMKDFDCALAAPDIAANPLEKSLKPWETSPHQLISWWTMERFSAEKFFGIAVLLERMGTKYRAPKIVGDSMFQAKQYSLPKEEQEWISENFRMLAENCSAIGLDCSAKNAKHLRGILAAGSPSVGNIWIAWEIEKAEQIILHEMEDELFLYVPSDRAEFYLSKQLFGPDVQNSFPSAAGDVEEAGKCFAAGRYTACVFHLMRVLEIGLRSLSGTLNSPGLNPKNNPNWGDLLRGCNDELAKPPSKRSPEWQADTVFFSEATANLRAVKDAWRNPTMHVEISYDEQKARDVWNASVAFMRHLSTKLRE
jgi:hypothetical protein